MSLKEIAQELGLSLTTVSRALNGYSDVSGKTRELVVAAAKARGYRPNPSALRLATGRTNAIGVVYPLTTNDISDPLFLDVVGGMTTRLDKAGFDLLIISAMPGEEMRPYVRMIEGRRVDALIVARTLMHDPRLEYLSERGYPFVAYGRSEITKPYA